MAPAQLFSSLWTRPHFPHLVPLVNLWTATPVSNYFLRQLDDISAASRYMDPYAFLATDPRLFFEGFPLQCSHQEQPESSRRHTPELGDATKDSSTMCPQDSERFNVLRGSVCQMAQNIPYLLPGQRIHISKVLKKRPTRRHRKCPRNQPLVSPVWRKEFSVPPDRLLYLRSELYVVMGVVQLGHGYCIVCLGKRMVFTSIFKLLKHTIHDDHFWNRSCFGYPILICIIVCH